ncbi:ParB N-terminal domain-containing protein [Edaphobacter aggregans]|uniref:ParB N-terminal domain-containing protein n=1 Tax=Edaphobacter aggregans TaxID=570835 RepID=UPI00054E92BF|nr:ParB N-terminal domain-containing protein [Edaphobacter aggregans]
MTTAIHYEYGMPVHPVCDMFPLMDGDEVENLRDDIEDNGLLHPIVVHEGQLVDGRNRILACQQAKVKPHCVEWRAIYHGPQTLARWIWSINGTRRHLTTEQWLAIQVEIQAWEEREAAKQKQIEGGRSAGRSRPKTKQVETERSQPIQEAKRAPQVRTQIATQLNISERKVQQALNVQKADPALLKQVAKGTVKLLDAAKQVGKTSPPKKLARNFDVKKSIQPILRALHRELFSRTSEQRSLLLVELADTIEQMRAAKEGRS